MAGSGRLLQPLLSQVELRKAAAIRGTTGDQETALSSSHATRKTADNASLSLAEMTHQRFNDRGAL